MQKTSLKIKVGIYALSMLSMATLVTSPVMGSIIQSFPGKGVSQVQMILSIANLTGIIAAFIVGRLALSISKRTIALTGALGTCLFGLISYFFSTNLTALIILSGLIGVTVGFITIVIPGLIAENFSVEDRQSAMGKHVFFVSIGTMFLMFTSGFLGGQAWHNAYFTYLFAGVIFLVSFFCLPKNKTIVEQQNEEKHSLKEVLNKKVLAIAAMGFCFMVVNNAFNNNISILVTEQGFGSSEIAGTLTMIAQFGGLLAGLTIGKIAKITKSYTIMTSFAVQGFSFIVLFLAGSVPLLIIGSFISGVAQAMFFSQAPFLITISVHPILISMGMAVLSTANALGGFLSPSIINGLNQAMIGFSAQGAMAIGAILSFVVAIIASFANVRSRKLETA